jgi:hypothetical protein
MQTLQQIAENPSAATISENLVLVADPFGQASSMGLLNSNTLSSVASSLEARFPQGEILLSRFREDLLCLDGRSYEFDQYFPQNLRETLDVLMEHLPARVRDKLKSINSSDQIRSQRRTRKEVNPGLVELARHFSEWDKTSARGSKAAPFDALSTVPQDNVTVMIRKKPNTGYGSYSVLGWLERTKKKDRIVDKVLGKIFNLMNEFDRDGFYRQPPFLTDTFGFRVFGAGRNIVNNIPKLKGRIDGLLYPTDKSKWDIIAAPVRYSEDPDKKDKMIEGYEYVLRPKITNTTHSEVLQVQVFELRDYLLFDFFERDGRAKMEARRKSLLGQYERENKHLYRKMKTAMMDVLPHS